MQEEADAFIALPGGFGTLEELLEMVTWQQLGYHTKPVGVLNTSGFYSHLIAFADHLVEEASLLMTSSCACPFVLTCKMAYWECCHKMLP